MIHLAPEEEAYQSPTLMERMAEAFSPSGILSKSPDFEYRREQQRMARIVGKALEKHQPVVIEAATGVGKSLAYLLPAITYAIEEGKKAIISTHTINLQEQLMHKDIPIVQKLIRQPFQAELLKGRGNYLCPSRLERAYRSTPDLFTSTEQTELRLIWEWAQETKDGTLSDVPFSPSPKVWMQVCSEAHVCTPRRCGGTKCYYQNAKKRLAEADVIVINHNLFFSLLSSTEDVLPEDANFLFPNDFLIVDEAHTLEAVASKSLGLHLSESNIKFELQRLFNPKTKKGYFLHHGDSQGTKAVMEALDALEEFFREAESKSNFPTRYSKEFRVHEPGLTADTLSIPLHRVIERAKVAGDAAKTDTARLEFHDLARRLTQIRASIGMFLDQSEDDHVYWVEKGANENAHLSFHSAPVDVSKAMSKIFFQKGKTCIFTSATLGTSEQDTLQYFKDRVGAWDCPSTQIRSPFNFDKQMKLYLVKDLPAPSMKDFEASLPKALEYFLTLSQGRAFVLFTSYTQMNAVAEQMESFFERKGWNLLIHGKHLQRSQMLEEFKKDTSSVLFGTESFWTGVDVPGESLSNVIITKLPFAVPDHPLTAARTELIEERGGNSFMEYSVPEAILKLRQGVGRLIRTKKDEGMCVILDNRVLSKAYGRMFLAALPTCPVQILKRADLQ